MSVYKEYSDPELIHFIKSDDERAFTEIFNRYQPLLYDFAYKKIRDQEESKDIIQEIFVNLWNNRKSFELKISLSGYLYRSVLNKILNNLKHHTIREEYVLSFQQMIEETVEETDYRIREKDIEKLIETEIGALPHKMREVFEMRKREFFTNKEIAKKLGISEQTVETHMKRALKALRHRLIRAVYLLASFI